MGKKLGEFGKSLLIFLLAATVLVLALLALPSKTLTSAAQFTALLKPFAGILGISEAELTYTEPAPSGQIVGAAQPIAVSICSPVGRQSFLYDDAVLDAAYEQLGSLLAQALDTAAQPSLASEKELFAALSAHSVYFRFPVALAPQTLGVWLQSAAPEAAASEQFVLALEEQTVCLYLPGSSITRYTTALPPETLSQALSRCVPDGSRFAFEDGAAAVKKIAPLSLLPADAPALHTLSAANPCDARYITSLAEKYGINPYGDARYVDDAGNTTFTEPGFSLTVSAQAEIVLRISDRNDGRFLCDSTDAARIEAARSMLEQISGDLPGAARLYLTEYAPQEDGAVCRFDYFCGGVPILLRSGAAAEVVFSGGGVRELRLSLRSFSLCDEIPLLLPASQAAAIAPEAQRMELIYADSGQELLIPGWRG